MDNTESRKLQPITVKLSPETYDRWKELTLEGAFETNGQLVAALIENYYSPMKANKDNEKTIAQQKETISSLSGRISEMEKELTALRHSLAEEQGNNENLCGKNEELASRISELEDRNAEMGLQISEAEKKQKQLAGHMVVPVSPLETECLKYLSERECKRRGRNDITPEIFFRYCVSEMLIKGNKFSVDCVPDRVINEIKARLNTEKQPTE